MTETSSPCAPCTDPAEKIGVMICGHGSRDVAAVDEFNRLAVLLRERLPQWPVESGFLEFARPIIHQGLDKLREAGCTRILAVPGMLFAAGHVKNDLPWEVNAYAAAHPELTISFGKELGIDTKLLQAARQRVEEAIAAADRDFGPVDRADTLLLVVGRGTNDPDANSNVNKVARMLWEGCGVGWTEVAYSGVTAPLVDAGLRHCVKLGYKRVVVFPYFLFTGILVRRIYDWVDDAAALSPDIQFAKAPYLNDHPLVIDSFVERVQGILSGDVAMNCQLCKYREQVIGFEKDVGTIQAGHHHHVRGAGTDHDHGHDHGHHHHHDHGHDHGHHHHGHDHHHHDHHDHDHDHDHHGHDHHHPQSHD
ncbi:sirohydrochlorin chelatase [Insolitispirillum peregrinum]|uniref:Sirohydrochlorin cobaltochelatase n=1 Tax=Insolitispirillum peregrinum TaxID=80876 RepID=A0A1N7JFJ4_9PROT|nr:sirohydrochlorin chelatase [Insolitispirillum peregrinum]SIS48078.1 sirohydrochlorin cobaltochelatase [Insolitispirillum peregrinum]